ncbi:hypothetical protein SAMN05443662_0075 [Sulfurivirga caldicuralii]|uniref:RNA polymerase sigma factor, sigma-70 family n=1 Tax=Sulfurivirga caldicuralii TaxID=364032 RepID=A0A1N6DE28_9GAMM|nr:hypothetical protein [Sulfurivirga caldicuralii]SIN69058.1 hypothetical protein SAMN05443662_0075 [Sulfurivirga caldicuralii]
MINTLAQHRQNEDREGFFAVLNEFLPKLKKYVANRLRTAVRKGWVPRGMYDPMDIVDEVYLEVYEQFDDSVTPEKLRVLIFRLADQKLEAIIEHERAHMKDLSIEALAAKELKELEEHITADAEGEVVFVEDLDDISYHQDDYKPKVYLLDEGFEEELVEVLDLPREILGDREKRQILAQTYQNLPTLSRIILDLRTRGGLVIKEIAEVRGMAVDDVEKVMAAIKDRFHRALGLK